ncbi:MAG: hypothetical protein M3P70_15930 [Actinomycetota bacterium]|nr:hypothetical protein [Actinomycetota bacterium]
MNAILSVIGFFLLLVSLAGIFFGVYMATDPRTRRQGVLFAIWWVAGVAAASGVLMRDVVTFTVGLLCLLVAGAVLVFEGGGQTNPPTRGKNYPSKGTPGDDKRRGSEKSTKENRSGRYGKAAS